MTSKPIIRYSVVDQMRDFEKYELVLKLNPINTNEDSNETIDCVLSGVWFGCDLKPKEVIHVLDAKYDNQSKRLHISNEFGFVVKSPDLLISSTILMSANYCMRKAWLSAKFSGWSQNNRPMLIGTIVHQLFQNSCLERVKGFHGINELFLRDINDFINDFYSIGITRNQVIEEVSPYIPSIAEWIDKYIHNMSDIENSSDSQSKSQNNCKLKVIKICDIEDSIWSPQWGLKGVVDLTLEVAIGDNEVNTKSIMPLELKTGKASFSSEHIGQVGLYSIMMEDMRPVDGLLLYLKDKPQMRRILTKRIVKRDLIQLRNRLVEHLKNVDSGPEPLNSYRICSKCDHLLDCALTLKTIESENSMKSRVMSEQLIPEVISHLSEKDLKFFKKWISLLNLEMKEVKERDIDSKVGFWTESSSVRESKGLCFGKLNILRYLDDSVVFIRSDKYLSDSKDFILSDSVMRRWERVVVSIDSNSDSFDVKANKQIALSMGFIKNIDNKSIELVLDKRVNRLQQKCLFRIDHLSNSGIILSNYTNLLRLMDSCDNQSEKLRNIIIGERRVQHSNKWKRKIVTKGKHILKTLNRVQQISILKALSTDSYQLLRGMPGAGKTQTIIAMIRLLVALDQSVLITSYTHAAVDNILLKLRNHSIDFLRVGSEKRVDPQLLSYTVSAQTSSLKTMEELEDYYTSVKVVASTCLGVSTHPIFKRRIFDYCIVDEASQVLLPTCLGPLFHCNRFLLVGDPKQLPPVVQSKDAKEGGLDQSLFVLLQNDSNTTDLTIQYRMNSEIMRISNELTYNGVLKCANLDVLTQTLSPKDLSFLNQNNWISQVMASDLNKSVLFIDTDAIPAPEVRDIKGKVFNQFEAKIVEIIVKNFLKYFDIRAQQIGVISPYQRQVRHIRELLALEDLDVNTVDQFQGRDKEIVIYSCVKSNSLDSFASNTEILNDRRRLNVALTRAKSKLILIGSKSTLIKFNPFYQLFSILRSDQILSLISLEF